MVKELYCKDIGMDCDFLACGKTEEEALSKLGQHVLATHGIEGFAPSPHKRLIETSLHLSLIP